MNREEAMRRAVAFLAGHISERIPEQNYEHEFVARLVLDAIGFDQMQERLTELNGLDEATRIRINELNGQLDQMQQELEQARADVLRFRKLIVGNNDWSLEWRGSPYGGALTKAEKKLMQLLDETEHYE